jgi:hypothetical protein
MTYWHLPDELKLSVTAGTAFLSPPALIAFREGFASRNWKQMSQKLIPEKSKDDNPSP